jgi:indole-3-glycerol phosphate synthase
MTSSRSGTYLDRILAAHRADAEADERSFGEVLTSAQQIHEPARGFARALVRTDRLAVIAEVKRRSPSKGALREDLDPSVLASVYESGGAACLSVLTDAEYFGGSTDDLQAARAACTVPVLRKDFTVSPVDVCDARLMGADAVLLIAAALDDAELADLHALAVELGLDALVEVHDEDELDRAVSVGATLVGVNQRDLVTFEVDTDRAERVGRVMPDDVVRVAESGVRKADDASRLAQAGYHAVLVGESLVTSTDPAAALGALRVERGPKSTGPASPCP